MKGIEPFTSGFAIQRTADVLPGLGLRRSRTHAGRFGNVHSTVKLLAPDCCLLLLYRGKQVQGLPDREVKQVFVVVWSMEVDVLPLVNRVDANR